LEECFLSHIDGWKHTSWHSWGLAW
jgi:hypothetical protein